MSVYVCPVCSGRGIVRGDFYSLNSVSTTSDTTICRSCGGKGIVFAQEVFSNMIYENSFCQSFRAKGSCANCSNNGNLGQLNAYRCTIDGELHESDYRCEHWSEQVPMYGTFDQIWGKSADVRGNKNE